MKKQVSPDTAIKFLQQVFCHHSELTIVSTQYSTTNVIIGISVGVFVRGWTLTDGTRIFEIKLSFTFAEKKHVWKEFPRDVRHILVVMASRGDARKVAELLSE